MADHDQAGELAAFEAGVNNKADLFQSISERKIHNEKQSINKLPLEIFLHIIALSEEMALEERRWKRLNAKAQKQIIFRDLAEQVCSCWRNSIINTPALWTGVHVSPSLYATALRLERVGSTILLDIDLDLSWRYWKRLDVGLEDHAEQTTHLSNLLDLLTAHGANINCWRSLQVFTSQYPVLAELTRFLNNRPTHALLSLTWERDAIRDGGYHKWIDESQFDSDDFYPLSASLLSNLRELEPLSLPLSLISLKPLTRLANITKLSITLSNPLVELSRLWGLLSLCDRLESLDLSAGLAEIQTRARALGQRVSLSFLHSFKIHFLSQFSWVLDLMRMVDAPVLHELVINRSLLFTPVADSRNSNIFRYLATGQLNNKMKEADPTGFRGGVRYPSVKSLDISWLSCTKDVLYEMFT